MANVSVSKKPYKLNLTRCQISVFHEVIDLTDQMSVFLNCLYPQKLIPADIKLATDLVRKWESSRNTFISKTTSLLECMYSLERAQKEYAKLISSVSELTQSRVIMASMLDRVRQIVEAFRSLR
jgi:hypothetical protein